mmetsp:Transcript_2584/g.6602  ORF Transcript_2584/g.6602 Transcript_2584/m.6602 type:complete len:194 (-) Transcript_2584:685-1266(-)
MSALMAQASAHINSLTITVPPFDAQRDAADSRTSLHLLLPAIRSPGVEGRRSEWSRIAPDRRMACLLQAWITQRGTRRRSLFLLRRYCSSISISRSIRTDCGRLGLHNCHASHLHGHFGNVARGRGCHCRCRCASTASSVTTAVAGGVDQREHRKEMEGRLCEGYNGSVDFLVLAVLGCHQRAVVRAWTTMPP